jgi:hypothetical protein
MSTRDAQSIPGFAGQVIAPTHPDYNRLRTVYNAAVDHRPALILRCRGTADIAAGVRFASDHQLPLSVYGGGHGARGTAVTDGAVVVDMREIRGVWVDGERATVEVQAGATWRDVDAETQAHGLAVTGARISTVGVAGYTLGGGSGWLERKLGLACDNLIAAQLVTPRGELVTASEESHSDLFWALHGGGGNFGIVTSLRFALHDLGPHVLAGLLLYPHGRAGEVLDFYSDFMADAPSEVCGGAALLIAPPAPFVPEPARGKPALGIVACYAGAVEDGETALGPLRAFGPPAVDLVHPMRYTEFQQLLDGSAAAGAYNHWHGMLLEDLDGQAIDTLVRHTAAMPADGNHVIVEPVGGAVHRDTGMPLNQALRSARFKVHVIAHGPADSAHANAAWADQVAAELARDRRDVRFPSYESACGEHLLTGTYGAPNYARLQGVRSAYDPDGLLRPEYVVSAKAGTYLAA